MDSLKRLFVVLSFLRATKVVIDIQLFESSSSKVSANFYLGRVIKAVQKYFM